MEPAQSILIIEDDPAILRLVTAALHAAGYKNVNAAASIREARGIWEHRNGSFDLLVTDFSLPDGSAMKFIEELRAVHPSLNVILMSGYSQEMLGIESEAYGISLLQKPFRPAELCELAGSCLSRACS